MRAWNQVLFKGVELVRGVKKLFKGHQKLFTDLPPSEWWLASEGEPNVIQGSPGKGEW